MKILGSNRIVKLALAASFLGLSACSSVDEDTYVARDVNTLYYVGMGRLEMKQYSLAAAVFDEVERQHPYSVWARRSMLMAAYAHYQANEYDDAILAAERFLQLHPGNTSAPYANYLIALCHYERITDVGRDQKVTRQAMEALREVMLRYPDTEYAKDARVKYDMTRDHLAGKEMTIGRFYQQQRQYLGAILRFKEVLKDYETTTHAPEAMFRLIECYLALGVDQEAVQIANVLAANYQDDKWYARAYELLEDEGVITEAGLVLQQPISEVTADNVSQQSQ